MIKEKNAKIYGTFKGFDPNSRVCFIVRGYLYENNHAIYDVFPVIMFSADQDKSTPMMLDLMIYTKSIVCRDIGTFEIEFNEICEEFEKAKIEDDNKCHADAICDNDVDMMMYNYIEKGKDIIQVLITDTLRNNIYEYIGRVDLEDDTVDMIYRVSSEGDDYPHDCKLEPDRLYHLISFDTLPNLEVYRR